MDKANKRQKSKKKNSKAVNIPTIIIESPSASSSSLVSETRSFPSPPPSYENCFNSNSQTSIQTNSRIPEEPENLEDAKNPEDDSDLPEPEASGRRASLRRNSISLPNLEDLEIEIIKNLAQDMKEPQGTINIETDTSDDEYSPNC
ncbi:hypothetical protein ILUMI_04873, partial [Ignelater luminosus]